MERRLRLVPLIARIHAKIFIAHPRADRNFLGAGAWGHVLQPGTGVCGFPEFIAHHAAWGLPWGKLNAPRCPRIEKILTVEHLLLAAACIPFVYYLLSLYSTMRYFRSAARENKGNADFTPPVSCLKPVKGADEDAYENYASFCRQDYPDYEILFCVDKDDPRVPVLEQLVRDFPERRIRLLFGSGRNAVNDKVARLTRLVNEAQHDIFVITDSDVRVRPEYLRDHRGSFSRSQSRRSHLPVCFHGGKKSHSGTAIHRNDLRFLPRRPGGLAA